MWGVKKKFLPWNCEGIAQKNTYSNPTPTQGNHSNPSPVVSLTRISTEPGQSDTFSLTHKHAGWFFMCCAVTHNLSYSYQNMSRHIQPTLCTPDLSSFFLIPSLCSLLCSPLSVCLSLTNTCTVTDIHIDTCTHFSITTRARGSW